MDSLTLDNVQRQCVDLCYTITLCRKGNNTFQVFIGPRQHGNKSHLPRSLTPEAVVMSQKSSLLSVNVLRSNPDIDCASLSRIHKTSPTPFVAPSGHFRDASIDPLKVGIRGLDVKKSILTYLLPSLKNIKNIKNPTLSANAGIEQAHSRIARALKAPPQM